MEIMTILSTPKAHKIADRETSEHLKNNGWDDRTNEALNCRTLYQVTKTPYNPRENLHEEHDSSPKTRLGIPTAIYLRLE